MLLRPIFIITVERTTMNDWITDRKPIEHDESYVYDSFGHVCHWIKIANGEPWKPIPKCEPYVKPSRFEIYGAVGGWQVWGVRDNKGFDIIGFISRDHAKQAIKQLEKVTQ